MDPNIDVGYISNASGLKMCTLSSIMYVHKAYTQRERLKTMNLVSNPNELSG